MKKYLLSSLLVVALVASLFALTGCGEKKEEKKEESKSNTTTQNTSADTTAATSENNANVQLEATEFYIQNLVPNTTIKAIYASVANADTWTPDLLGGLELATGTQAKIGLGLSELTSSWDIKVTDEEGTDMVFQSIDLSSILANKGGSVALQLNEDNLPTAVVK